MTSPSILIVSNYEDSHVDRVLDYLEELGFAAVRWHPDELPARQVLRACNSELTIDIPEADMRLEVSQIRSAWYRKPARRKAAHLSSPHDRIAEVESAAIASSIYSLLRDRTWYSNPIAIEAASSKLGQLAYAQAIGLAVPAYFAGTTRSDLVQFSRDQGSVVVKPLDSLSQSAVGIEPGADHFTRLDVRAFAPEELEAKLPPERLPHPLFVQRTVEKAFDVRATVIGHDAFAAAIHAPPSGSLDWRPETALCQHEAIDTPEHIRTAMLRFLVDHGLNYGAFDFAVDEDGKWWFLECNPNGQFAWIEEKCSGMPMSRVMAECLALKRRPLNRSWSA